MNLLEQLNRMKILSSLKENISNSVIAFHGTGAYLPFDKFDSAMIGTGIVSTSQTKYGGFFFTSEFENAEFYTEYFIAKVEIKNIFSNPLTDKHSPTVLKKAVSDNKIYHISDYLDGNVFSDITVVPITQLGNVRIIEWIFVGDEEMLFNKYDSLFGGGSDEDEEVYINQHMIIDLLDTINIDISYLLQIPIFKKYYDLRNN